MSQPCSTHADQIASHQCDGCQQALCVQCFSQSHALLLCSHCGERALPIAGAGASTVHEQRQQSQVAEGLDYRLRDAWLYPFRGSGPFMFLAAFAVGRPLGCVSVGSPIDARGRYAGRGGVRRRVDHHHRGLVN